jgi:Phage tail lysozyme
LEIYATGPAPEAPDVDWTTVGGSARLAYAVRILTDRYGYPPNGAAGIVGNLWAESGVLPSRIEGSASTTPTRARDFAGVMRDFSLEEIMQRDPGAQLGPKLPGVGLAQWTSRERRAKLFTHDYDGQVLGAYVLFDMDAQLDYLAVELQGSYPGVHAVVADPGVTVEAASDDVVYRFEVPGAILSGGTKLPRGDPRVQAVFRERRSYSIRALNEYRSA